MFGNAVLYNSYITIFPKNVLKIQYLATNDKTLLKLVPNVTNGTIL
jgi:hypothetical protein